MPKIIDGIEYLNAAESAQFLNMSPVTFRIRREEYNLQPYTLLGKGNGRYYKVEDLQRVPRVQPGNNT